jgi:ketosteroid isomerase-like protein
MDTESTRDLIMKFLEARQANDRDAIFALLTEDAEWRPPLSARMGPFSGRAAVADALAGGAAGAIMDVSTMRREVRKVIVDGDSAAVQQRVTAKALNGRDYENEYSWFYTCRDGQIWVLDEYADTLNAARIFGFVSEK